MNEKECGMEKEQPQEMAVIKETEEITSHQRNTRCFLWILVGVVGISVLAVGLNVGLKDDNKYDRRNRPRFLIDLPVISSETLRTKYESCEALRPDLIEATHLLANSVIDRNARWYYDEEYYYTPRSPVEGDAGREFDSSTSNGGSEGIPAPSKPIKDTSYDTNNQVEGVEEADVVQSNGKEVYAIYGKEIVVLDAAEVTVLSRTTIPDPPSIATFDECYYNRIVSLLLIDEQLVVITRGYCNRGSNSSSSKTTILQDQGQTAFFVYNTTDMSLSASKTIQGSYVSARAIGKNVHIITSSWINSYSTFTSYLDPYNEELYGKNPREGNYRNQALIEAGQRTETFVDQLTNQLDCSSIQQIALMQNSDDTLGYFAGALESMATIHSFSVNDPTNKSSVTSMLLPTSGWEVYASEEQLVLATQGWYVEEGEGNGESSSQQTYLLAYRLEGPSVSALSLGTVPGYVLNQFSMDHAKYEDKDYLRVASSIRERWAFNTETSDWERTEEATSQVTILEITGDDKDKMPITGSVDNLGKEGERIYSVRFQGERGFVVTFQETDPFYTLDLSNPKSPKKVGELEIPGFSNYLHPIGDNLILGVGQHVVDRRRQGLQISLFNVSDFANPTRIQNFVEDSGYSTSEAQYDHKAFRYLEESKLLILPVTIYGDRWDDDISNDDDFDGFQVYQIDEEDGISVYFTIEHASGNLHYGGCWSYDGYLEARALVFEGDIMTLKGHTILSHDLTDKVEDQIPINLDENLPVEECTEYYFND